MQNHNIQNLTLIAESPKMQEKITKLGRELFRHEVVNGQKFVVLPKILGKMEFSHFMIDFGVTSLQIPSSPDFLTLAETNDVTVSLKEIKEGRAKKFKSVDDFLKELKE